MDFEAAAKLSGARFVVLNKGLARLESDIGQFMLDLHPHRALLPRDQPGGGRCWAPTKMMFGTGQLPKFEDDQLWAHQGRLSLTRY